MPLAYAYNASDGIFYARTLAGVAQADDNYSSGFFGFISAAANETHIFAFNNAADEVVIWERDWTTVSTTITPNSPTNQYRGLALTDTHLVLLNHTENQLEYYLLTDYSYVSSLTVSLDTKAWGGAARGGDKIFLGNNTDDDIERRELDGTADIDFSTGISLALQSIYASDSRVWVINRTTGAGTAFDHDGTAQTADNHAWGAGNWQAAFVLPDETPAPVALSFGTETVDNQAWEVDTSITSLTLPEATGGNGTITYSLSPTLPTGVTFSAGNRRISGTPTGRFASASFTYTATDADGTTVELTFTSVVTATALSFASNIPNQAWVVGTAVSLTLPTASGGVGTLIYSLTPTLPSGVTFTAASRALAGNPTGRFAVATFTYTVTDTESITHTQTFTAVVTATAITFNPTSFADQMLTMGMAVSLTLPEGAGGVGTLTASLTGTLPSGLSFTASTRVLAGNPSVVFDVATFTFTMTDEESVSASISFTILVASAPAPDVGYFYDLNELVSADYDAAEIAVVIPNAAGDDVVGKRATRAIAKALILRNAAQTYALIDSLVDYVDLLNKPTIPTLRTAGQTYSLIQSLLDFEDLLNKPTILTSAQVATLIEAYGEPFTTALLSKLNNIAAEADVTGSANVLTALEAMVSAQQVNARSAVGFISVFERDTSKDISQAVLQSAASDITPQGITWDGTSVLVADANNDAVWGFTNGARDSTKDISQAVLRSANSNILPAGITWDDTSVLVLDRQGQAVWGFTNGARDTTKDISQAVLRSANSNIFPQGITWDGTSVLVADANNDAVWGFTNGARDTTKDISQAVLQSAASNITPEGITWDGTSVLVADANNDAVWGFTNGARDTTKDISQAVLQSAASNITPQGITWDGTSVLVADQTNDAVWGFTRFTFDGSQARLVGPAGLSNERVDVTQVRIDSGTTANFTLASWVTSWEAFLESSETRVSGTGFEGTITGTAGEVYLIIGYA